MSNIDFFQIGALKVFAELGQLIEEDEKKQENRQYNNQYRIDNNEIINNKKKEKFTCACNGRYTKTHKAEHLKSKKHKQFEQQEIINNKTYNSILFFKIFS
jgi:hypothetical protein